MQCIICGANRFSQQIYISNKLTSRPTTFEEYNYSCGVGQTLRFGREQWRRLLLVASPGWETNSLQPLLYSTTVV